MYILDLNEHPRSSCGVSIVPLFCKEAGPPLVGVRRDFITIKSP